MKFELSFKGKSYIVEDTYEYERGHEIPFMWTEGNFSCDCNKSLFIQEQCDASFPEMECGDEIKLVRRIS